MNWHSNRTVLTMGAIIVMLLGVISYLIFFREHPCDTMARIMTENEPGTLSPALQEQFLAANLKCRDN